MVWVTIQPDGEFYESFDAQAMALDLVKNQRLPMSEAWGLAEEMWDALLQYPEDLL